MNKLKVKYLGIPYIRLDGESIILPYKKAEMIVYYLVVEKEVSRDRLSSIIWDDMDEKSAKKNLRNAVYVIRQRTNDDFIISPKRDTLAINPNYEIETDIDNIYKFDACTCSYDEDIEYFISMYNDKILDSIVTEAGDEFTKWTMELEYNIRNLFLDKLKTITSSLIAAKEYSKAEICAKKLIEIDEYEEVGYKFLITAYDEMNKYQKAIGVYSDLVKFLDDELSVKPSKEIEELYNNILDRIEITDNDNYYKFYGRDEIKDCIYTNINNFIKEDEFKSIVITGEDGIGKSLLLNKIASECEEEVLVIKIKSFEYEMGFIFKFWDMIFEKISNSIVEKNIKLPEDSMVLKINNLFPTLKVDKIFLDAGVTNTLNYDLIERSIFDLFSFISNEIKILLIVDDLNNVDTASLELLYKTILSNRYNIMLIASARKDSMDFNNYFYHMLEYNNLVIERNLERFNKDETKSFVDSIMPEANKYIDEIYLESEGNPLFIKEIVNSFKEGNINDIKSNDFMTSKIENIIRSRLDNLSREANKLVSICSLFYEGFNINKLGEITNINKIDLIDIIEELIDKEILKETVKSDGTVDIYFTHNKTREYVYNSMSKSKQMLLHEKIAEYYRHNLEDGNYVNRVVYPEIIHHYKSANNRIYEFKYRVLWLEDMLDKKHEIFPIVEDVSNVGLIKFYLDEESLEEQFAEIEFLYNSFVCNSNINIVKEEIIYLYLYGRFNKGRGFQKEGLEYLEKMISIAESNGYLDYAYYGHLQLIHNYINIEDIEGMKKHILKAEDLAEISDNDCDIAIVLRLKGYCYILEKEYELGRKLIKNSIKIFKNSENRNRYILNISASYFYIGESYRAEDNYKKAEKYYDKSLKYLPENSEDSSAAALIFSKIGNIKYLNDNMDEALFYYLKSLKAYENNIFVWGKADVYYYLYKIYDNKYNYKKASHYIKCARRHIDDYTSSEIKKLIYEVEL